MTDDVIHATQHHMKYENRTILENVQRRPLKLGRLIVLLETHLHVSKFCFQGKPLFSSPQPLHFKLLLIFNSENLKEATILS